MSSQGAGGSRAAKKRKKKLDSANGDAKPASSSSGLKSSKTEGSASASDDSTKKENAVKAERSTVALKMDEEREVNLSGRSVVDLLSLEDPREVTTEVKAALLLSALLEPAATVKSFYNEYWGKKPLLAHRQSKSFLKGLLSKRSVVEMLEDSVVYLGEDIEVFTNNLGETEGHYDHTINSSRNSEDGGVEMTSTNIWKRYKKGATLRLLQPQKHLDLLWNFLASLEFEFCSRVGCHADIIPPASAGWGKILMDTSDSFVVQMQGSSLWRLYARKKDQVHSSQSSFISSSARTQEEALTLALPVDNFVSAVLAEVPYVETRLHAGDSLYIPKGWGFSFRGCGETGEGDNTRSSEGKKEGKLANANMHLRLFTNSGNSVGELLDLALPAALETCRQEEGVHSASLPRDYASLLGATNSELDEHPSRMALMELVQVQLKRVSVVAASLIDSSADQLIKAFMGQRLPVPLTPDEESKSAASLVDPAMIKTFTKLRMIRPGIARVVIEEGVCALYHCMDNSRELYGNPLRPLEFDLDDGVCIEALLAAYPSSIMVADLPHPSEEDEDKVGVAQALFKEGFLLIDDEVTAVADGGGDNDDGNMDEESEEEEDDDNPF